ncbi:MAG: ATP-binding cassette domain-containing protein [Pirellulaceae bacterium]
MPNFNEEICLRILTRVGLALGVPIERSDLQSHVLDDPDRDPLRMLEDSAEHAGIFLCETAMSSAREVFSYVREGYPVIVVNADGSYVILERLVGRRVAATRIDDHTRSKSLSRRRVTKLLRSSEPPRCFVCKKELECESISSRDDLHANDHDDHDHDGHHHEHASPLRRFIGLLNMDRRDIWSVVLFALVAGILSLATPLAIESLVNVVSWGTYLQPLIVLGLMLLTCLGLAGVLKLLQTIVVELIQRRQFVRIVSDLAHRFPRANQASLKGEYPRELANRVFDVMTIQKATAVLLLDGISIVLTTILGLVLLAFYHPFLLGFDIVLVIAMISITWVLGRGGIRTAIEESITKYRTVHWLQDVISSPAAFKTGGGESLAIQRANQLSANYVLARQQQFRVVIRQITFAIVLQVLASTAVLALGGWLVIDGQLTLGQLVASELVVTVVVGAFAKAGKSLEKFYDLMAGVDKVGHLVDVPTDPRQEISELDAGPAAVKWGDLEFHGPSMKSQIPASVVNPGDRVAIVGSDVDGRALLSKTLAGLVKPAHGQAQVAGYEAANAAISRSQQIIGYGGQNDLFHGTLRENIELGRSGIGPKRIREALQQVGLAELPLKLPLGLQAQLQTHGYPLTPIQARQVTLARAIVAEPKLLIVDGLLDDVSSEDREVIWESLSKPDAPWTLIVNTNREDVAQLCNSTITVRK